MKPMLAALTLLLMLAPFSALGQEGLPEGVQPPDAEVEITWDMAEIYSYSFRWSQITLGLLMRPDMYFDLSGDQALRPQIVESSLLQPSSYLGTFGEPLDEVVRGFLEAPRLLSVEIKF